MNTQSESNSENKQKKVADGQQSVKGTAVSGGVGGVVGAAVGVVVGTVMPQTANAAEVEGEVVADDAAAAHQAPAHDPHLIPVGQETPETPEIQEKPETPDGPENPENPETPETPDYPVDPDGPDPIEPDPEPQVIGFDVIQFEDGTEGSMATIDHNGQIVIVADTTGDGYANIMASDLNENGHLDPGEGVDITEDHISMSQLQQEYEQNLMAAEEFDNGPDYVNDGNVDDFMA